MMIGKMTAWSMFGLVVLIIFLIVHMIVTPAPEDRDKDDR